MIMIKFRPGLVEILIFDSAGGNDFLNLYQKELTHRAEDPMLLGLDKYIMEGERLLWETLDNPVDLTDGCNDCHRRYLGQVVLRKNSINHRSEVAV
jgi:hypothetical protein